MLSQNLVHGDALTMRTHDGQPITFAEWGYLGKGKFQRRDFRLDSLTQSSAFSAEGSLFAHLGKHEIFTPAKTYPPMTVSELAAALATPGGGRMSDQASFALRGRNPDVLTCIANLSNDEVFTPPEFANRMLDTLAEAWAANHGGANIWADKTVKFLDPCTKSGVFLREITSRLTKGLAAGDSGPGEARQSHPDEAGVRHRHHATHQPAGAAQRVLLEARQRQALHRQVLRQRRWQHLVQAHRAHVGRTTSASTAAQPNDRL